MRGDGLAGVVVGDGDVEAVGPGPAGRGREPHAGGGGEVVPVDDDRGRRGRRVADAPRELDGAMPVSTAVATSTRTATPISTRAVRRRRSGSARRRRLRQPTRDQQRRRAASFTSRAWPKAASTSRFHAPTSSTARAVPVTTTTARPDGRQLARSGGRARTRSSPAGARARPSTRNGQPADPRAGRHEVGRLHGDGEPRDRRRGGVAGVDAGDHGQQRGERRRTAVATRPGRRRHSTARGERERRGGDLEADGPARARAQVGVEVDLGDRGLVGHVERRARRRPMTAAPATTRAGHVVAGDGTSRWTAAAPASRARPT